MKNKLPKSFLISILFLLSLCSCTFASQQLSIYNKIDIPIPVSDGRLVLGEGPLFVARQKPLLVYRVIKKSEIEFSGSEKNVFDFFNSVFLKQEGVIESSLFSSFEGYKISAKKGETIKVYFLEKQNETKLYIISPNLDFAIEVISEGKESKLIAEEIFKKTKLTKGI